MTILIGFYLFHLLEGPLHWPCGDCGGCPAEDGNFILTHGHVEEGRLSDSPVSKFVKAPGGPPTWGYWPSSLREWAFKQAHRILIGRGPLPVVLVAFGLWPPPNWYFTLALIPRHPSFNRTLNVEPCQDSRVLGYILIYGYIGMDQIQNLRPTAEFGHFKSLRDLCCVGVLSPAPISTFWEQIGWIEMQCRFMTGTTICVRYFAEHRDSQSPLVILWSQVQLQR